MAKHNVGMYVGLAGAGIAVGGLAGFLLGKRQASVPHAAGAHGVPAAGQMAQGGLLPDVLQPSRGHVLPVGVGGAVPVAEITVPLRRVRRFSEAARQYLAAISGYYRDAPGRAGSVRRAVERYGRSTTRAPGTVGNAAITPFPASPSNTDVAWAGHSRTSVLADRLPRDASAFVLINFTVPTDPHASPDVSESALLASVEARYQQWLRESGLRPALDTATAVGGGPIAIR